MKRPPKRGVAWIVPVRTSVIANAEKLRAAAAKASHTAIFCVCVGGGVLTPARLARLRLFAASRNGASRLAGEEGQAGMNGQARRAILS